MHVAQSARVSGCVCLCECGVRHCCGRRRILLAEARRREPRQKSSVFLLCAADGCGSETERRRGAEGKVTARKEERLKGSDRMWAAELLKKGRKNVGRCAINLTAENALKM